MLSYSVCICLLITIAVAQNCPSTPCSTGQCCSTHGYCGTTSDYCNTGNCVANCWSGCKLGGTNSCPAGQCCSQYGYCGTTADYCSPSNNCFSGCWASTSTTGSTTGSTTSTPTSPPAGGYVFAGYIPSWITQRPASCALSLASMDPTKYTHLLIPFAQFDTSNFVLTAMNNDDKSGWYTSVLGLKSRNPNLKVLISVGGGAFGTSAFSIMAGNAANRAKFIANAIIFARSHNFDGIDIDWETPDNSQTANIQSLFNTFRININADAQSSGKPALLLTLTSPNYNSTISAFGFANIQSYVDWIGVMNYDYYGPGWSTALGSNTGYNSVVSTFSAFSGVPTNKLLLGFANYARGFTLASSTSPHTPGSPFKGPGQPGPCSQDPDGTLTYNEVASVLNTNNPTIALDSAAQTPYLYYGTQWVTYDDIASIKVKVDYLVSKGMKGAMVWTVDSNHTLTDYIASRLST